jgi:RecB family exonuclease
VDETDLLEALSEAVSAESDDVSARRPPYPALWRLQREQMHAALRDYLLQQRAVQEPRAESLCFELGFAAADASCSTADERSTDEPVELNTPVGPIRLRGRIDRVDRVRHGEMNGLLVIDYKTSRPPKRGDVTQGRNLQLPIYAAAAAQVLKEPCIGGAFHHVGARSGNVEWYFAAIRRSGGACRPDGAFEADRDAAIAQAGRFVQAMRDGRFDLLPTHRCPSYCPFRQICHYAPVRAELKGAATEAEDDR